MPGDVSSSYDPEFSTGENAHDVREAVRQVRDRVSRLIGSEELKPIVGVARGNCGWAKDVRLTEKELRVIRFCLNRALDDI